MSHPDTATVLRLTRAWLETFVIGLNLCPFAATPYRQGRIAYAVCDGASREAIYRAFLESLNDLILADPRQIETALLIAPQGLDGFEEYLDTLDLLERAVIDVGLDGVIQVASFHPAYRFDDAPMDDLANFTNRSPFPMFHLIREEGLAAALESYPSPESIPQRNIARLRELGVAGIEKLMESVRASGE